MSDLGVKPITGTAIAIHGNDIDTDRIIPARYLKAITFSELGQYPFQDERFEPDGTPRDHPFNREERRNAKLLFVNENFGCGSSRETAPRGIKHAGVGAVIARTFARNFFRNSLCIGLPVLICADAESIEQGDRVRVDPIAGTVENLTKGQTLQAEPLPDHIMDMVKAGGLVPYLKLTLT